MNVNLRFFVMVGLGLAGFSLGGLLLAQESNDAARADSPTSLNDNESSDNSADDDGRVTTPEQPSVDEVLEAFQKQRPRMDPLTPTKGPDVADSDAEPGAAPRLADGFYLNDRMGYLTREDPWYTFVFDSQDGASGPNEMKLLPNRMLEILVRETENSTETVHFEISGEVTEFMNENYLLVRKALRQRDVGNLKK